MTTAPVHFACDACGKRFRAPADKAGRTFPCTACNTTVTVPAESTHTDPLEDLVGFNCSLCSTRMSVPTKHVGKKVRCPDCDRINVVPPPEAKPKKRSLAALEEGADTYEVFEGEEQPWGVDLARGSKRFTSFVCRKCGTHLQGLATDVGKPVDCPDCGAKTPIPAPPKPKPKVALPAGPGYRVEAAAETSPEIAKLHDVEPGKVPSGYRELNEAKRRVHKGRPDPPPYPMLTGVMRIWRSRGILAAWLGLSVIGAVLGTLSVAIIAGLAAGGLGAIGGVLLLPIPLMLGGLWVTTAAMIFLTLLIDSSEGNDDITNWPELDVNEWVGPLLYVGTAVLMAAAPGFVTAKLIGQWAPSDPPWWTMPAAVLTSVWLCGPVVLLSQLEASKVWALVSPPLVRSLFRAPGSVLLFYAQTGVLLLVLVALAIEGAALGIGVVAALMGPAVFLWLLSGRLMGRLAWVLADRSAAADAAAEADEDDD
ncbi:MAG: hypothetical protein AAF805_05165 [Planctomycetota bacterium]